MAPKKQFDPFTLKPGTLVMGKYQGSPPWPSLVVPAGQLTNSLRKSFKVTPSNIKQKIPVFFFGERNFGFLPASKILEITPEDLETVHDVPNFEKALDEARQYQYPQDYIDILLSERMIKTKSDFVEWDSLISAPPLAGTAASDSTTSKNKKGGKRSNITNLTKDDDDQDHNSKSTVAKKRKKAASVAPEEDEATLRARVHEFRYVLQKGLIQRKDLPSEEEQLKCSAVLKEVEQFAPKMTEELLKYSKLHKVMRAMMNLNNLDPDHQFSKRCQDVLLGWGHLIVKIKNDKSRDTPNLSTQLESSEEAKFQPVTSSLKTEVEETNKMTNGDANVLKDESSQSIEAK